MLTGPASQVWETRLTAPCLCRQRLVLGTAVWGHYPNVSRELLYPPSPMQPLPLPLPGGPKSGLLFSIVACRDQAPAGQGQVPLYLGQRRVSRLVALEWLPPYPRALGTGLAHPGC